MEPVCRYQVNHEHQINHIIISGEISFEKLIQCKTEGFTEDGYVHSYNFLIDVRGMVFTDYFSTVGELVEYIRTISISWEKHHRCAFVTSTPMEVAQVEVFILNLINKINDEVTYKVFSTEPAAIQWLYMH